MWAGLQADYDLRRARYEKQRQIEHEVAFLVASRCEASGGETPLELANTPRHTRKIALL